MSHPTSQPPEKSISQLTLSPPSQLSGFEWWRRTLLYQTGLGFTDQDRAQYIYDYQNRNLEEKCQSCNDNLKWVLQYSPSVIFMMDHIRKLNKDNEPINPKFIKCATCDFTKGGGFDPKSGIVLCSNWIGGCFNPRASSCVWLHEIQFELQKFETPRLYGDTSIHVEWRVQDLGWN